MSRSVVEQIGRLQQAIVAQEGLREAWGDLVVETAVQALHKELAALQAQTAVEQRKQVTVLFADLAGFVAMAEAMDPEDVRDIMNAYFQCWSATIVEYGGLIEKFIGDAVMAVFGVPTARESDPENAVRAALAMRQELVVLNEKFQERYGVFLEMRVGLSTGPVLMSFLGQSTAAPELPEPGGEMFAVVGDTVNLASRLERAAPVDGTLISHDTYRHIRGVFNIRQLSPIKVKGKEQPVSVYLVLSVKPRAFRLTGRGIEGLETAMVGREDDLRRLREASEAVVEKRLMQVISIIGDSGVGKSRLLYEFRAWVQLHPASFRIFKGRARQEMRHLPFSLIRDMIAFRFQIQDSDSPPAVRQKLVDGIVAYMGPEGVEKAPFIGHLVGFDFSDSPHLQGILGDARQIRDRAFYYWRQLLTAVAGPAQVAFYLDDLHWVDDGSLDLILYLMRECADLPILFICLARPSLFERYSQWGQGHERHEFLQLDPLDVAHSRQLAAELLRPLPVIPDELRDMLVNVAEGNPYYMEELVKMLIEDQVIVKKGDVWDVRADRLADLRVPATLTGLLQVRLDSLTPAERETLQIASVVGRVFWEEAIIWLRHQTNPTADLESLAQETAAILMRLQLKELIYQQEETGFDIVQHYIFKQTFLRDVTYNSLLRRQRRQYHAQVARWFIESAGERLSELTGLIGEHFEAAEELETAVHWYMRAGYQAQMAYVPDTAIGYYQHALTHIDALPDSDDIRRKRLELHEGLGEMFRLQARYTEAAQAYMVMQELAPVFNNQAALTRSWLGLADIRASQGEYREALRCVERAELIAEQLGEGVALELVKARNRKSIIYFRLSDFERAAHWSEMALTLGRKLDARPEIARSLSLLAHVAHMQGRYDEVDSYNQQSLAIYQEVNDPQGIVVITTNLGEIARLRGYYTTANRLLNQAWELARSINDWDGEILARHNLAATAVDRGDYAVGEEALRQLIAAAATTGVAGLSESYRFLAEACLGQDKAEEALEAAREALVLAHEVEELEMIGAAWRVLGRIAAALDAPISLDTTLTTLPAESLDARYCFSRSLLIFRQIGFALEEARTCQSWADYELTAASGRPAQGHRYRQQALELFARLGITREIDRMELAVSN